MTLPMRVELSYPQSGKLLACSAAPREHPHGSTYPLAVTDRAADPCSLSDRPALRSPPAPVLAAASPSPCRRPGPLRRVSSSCHRLSTCHLSRRHSFRSIPCCAGRQQRRAAQAASQVWQSACGTKRPAAPSPLAASPLEGRAAFQHGSASATAHTQLSKCRRVRAQAHRCTCFYQGQTPILPEHARRVRARVNVCSDCYVLASACTC